MNAGAKLQFHEWPMRRGFREWTRSLPAFERLEVIDLVNIELNQDLKTLSRLVGLSDTEVECAEQASGAFRELVKFESQCSSSVNQQDLSIAVQEFSLFGFPHNVHGITGACFHDFLDQLTQAVIASVFDAEVPRPERVDYKQQFYDFYLDSFEECWHDYKPIFRDLKENVDLHLVYANLLSEYAKAWEPLKAQSETQCDIDRREQLVGPIEAFRSRQGLALDSLHEELIIFEESLKLNADLRLRAYGWKADPLRERLSNLQEFYRVEPPKTFLDSVEKLSFAEEGEVVFEALKELVGWIEAEKGRFQEELVFSYQLTSDDFAANTPVASGSQAKNYLGLKFDSENRQVTLNTKTIAVPGDSQWTLLRTMHKAAAKGLTIAELETQGFNKQSVYKIKSRLNAKLLELRISVEVDNRGLWRMIEI